MSSTIHEERFKRKALDSLIMSNQLTRAQLTVGPLRHLKNADRTRFLDRLVRDGLVTLERIEKVGPVTSMYRITEKGRRFVEMCRQTA